MARLFGALAGSLMLSSLLSSAACAETGNVVSGWTIDRLEGANTCTASALRSGQADLSIAIIGPEFLLLLSAPQFRQEPGTYPVAISVDSGQAMMLNAVGHGGVYGIALVPELANALRSGSTLTATIDGQKYTFDIRHAGTGMDAASRCAGMRTYVESFAHPPASIDSAGEWKIIDDLPGSDRCTVRKNGDQVDTILARNKDGALLLIAGRADWAFPAASEKVSLQFDDQPVQEMDASVFNNLIIVLLKDASAEQMLLHSTHLRWRSPQGEFVADLNGVGHAIDALRACDAKKAANGKAN